MKPKTAKPATRRAALFCSDFSMDIISVVTDAMRAGGFEPDVIAAEDIPAFATNASAGPSIWTKEHIAQSTTLTQMLKRYDVLVFDEWVDKRSGLEYCLFCKSSADTVRIPITLLHSPPADAVFIQACATVGIAHLIDKSDLGSIAKAFAPAEGSNLWRHFSEDAKQVIYYTQEEARKLHENYVSTEHLALGLMRDPECPGAKILDTQLGTLIEAVRTELAKHLVEGPGHNEAFDMQLTPRCKNVIDISYAEAKLAGRDQVGSEHLLLGLISEYQGLGGKVLGTLGITLDKARVAVQNAGAY